MKKILFVAVALVAILQSCDKIDAPYGTGGGGVIDTTSTDTTGNDASDTLQRVLLEEYTGHTCLNCPAAHQEAQALHNLYGEQLVLIAIHAGFYAQTQNNTNGSYSYDFRTPTGNAIFGFFLPSNQPFPTGVVHRKRNTAGNYATSYSAWSTNIAPLITKKPSARLSLTNTFDSLARTIKTSVKTTLLESLQDSLSLVVVYTEDSIVNWQKNGTQNVQSYVHRHALRGSLNGSWGEMLGTSFGNGLIINRTYTGSAIQVDVVPEHVSVVAILYNSNTQVVVQVAEKKLLP